MLTFVEGALAWTCRRVETKLLGSADIVEGT
jgi:hypothetical protein